MFDKSSFAKWKMSAIWASNWYNELLQMVMIRWLQSRSWGEKAERNFETGFSSIFKERFSFYLSEALAVVCAADTDKGCSPCTSLLSAWAQLLASRGLLPWDREPERRSQWLVLGSTLKSHSVGLSILMFKLILLLKLMFSIQPELGRMNRLQNFCTKISLFFSSVFSMNFLKYPCMWFGKIMHGKVLYRFWSSL